MTPLGKNCANLGYFSLTVKYKSITNSGGLPYDAAIRNQFYSRAANNRLYPNKTLSIYTYASIHRCLVHGLLRLDDVDGLRAFTLLFSILTDYKGAAERKINKTFEHYLRQAEDDDTLSIYRKGAEVMTINNIDTLYGRQKNTK